MMLSMGAKYRVTATYDIEVTDETALRDAAFKERHRSPALALSYDEAVDDSELGALKMLLGHGAITSVPGAVPIQVEVDAVTIEP